jgi:glycine/D-amino acid oxidase-like deaminating enzyme
MRHAPVWIDRFPKSRRPSYPRLRGEHDTRVVIIGGGLTGAACALSCAAAGIPSVLLEAEVIGGGLTAGSSGIIREGFAGSFHAAAGAHGLRTSRALWDGMRRGGLEFASALRRYRIKCDLEPREVITFAGPTLTAGRTIKREYETRRSSTIEGAWMTPAAVSRIAGFDSGGAIRTHGFSFDPYRACLGMIHEAVARGASVLEGSPVRRVRPVDRQVEVTTAGGLVRADWVIVATGAPIQDLRPLRRHLRAEHVYGVLTQPLSAAMRRGMGARTAALEDTTGEHRYIRFLSDDRVLVWSGRQPEVPVKGRERALVQRTGQLMYELLLLYPEIAGLQPESSWDRIDHETVDGLPFIGPHRNFPRHFFAFGSSRHGDGAAWVAARMALRYILGEAARSDEPFGFHRIL